MAKINDKCDRCGWKYGFHICVDFSQPLTPEEVKKREANIPSSKGRAVISSYQKERWARENGARDARMIKTYADEEISMVELAKRMGCSRATVIRVLNEAAARGDVKIRPRGVRVNSNKKQELDTKDQEVVDLFVKGYSKAAIARETGVSNTKVYRVIDLAVEKGLIPERAPVNV